MFNINLTNELLDSLESYLQNFEDVSRNYYEGKVDEQTYLKARDEYLAATICHIVNAISD